MKKKTIFALALMLSALSVKAANSVETVNQVSSAVILNDDVDYHISSADPFADGGSINITNTEHAAIILDNVLPSKAKTMLGKITVNGARAIEGVNCQVRLYMRGALILPYTENKVLTVYTGENFTGDAENSYEVDQIYNLSGKSMDNKISSFKLKRGYMVCLGTQADGKGGYSRVFIADKEDKEINLRSTILNKRVSFIRISKWLDTTKKGWAGTWSTETQNLFNTSWCYNWDDSNHRDWTDRDYVTQKHHDVWPGPTSVGNNTSGANILGMNEPDNNNDPNEHPLTVDQALALWPDIMATGRRIGSPAVAGNYNWLYQFIDSIDARGWRCDFIAVHAYWYSDKSSWESQLKNISKRCGNRPIWITEMNYGANWTGWPGSNTNGNAANYAIEKQHMAPTLDYLNSASYIERYAFYNNVQACRYAINTGDESLKDKGYLTPIGEYYAALPDNMAYSSDNEYVPKSPKMYEPQDLKFTFVPRTSLLTINWTDKNGEFCDSVFVECRVGTKGKWERIATVDVIDKSPAQYSYRYTVAEPGEYYYRIRTIDYKGTEHLSNVVNNSVNGSEGTEDVQWGTFQSASTENTYCFFEYPYAKKPVVVCGSPTFNDEKVVPVEHISTFSASNNKYTAVALAYQPWNADGTSALTKAEQSTYIVAKDGNGNLGGLDYEAGYQSSVRGDTVTVTFAKPFAKTPVVFATPQYSNTKYPSNIRVFDVTPTGFKLVQQRQKGVSTASFSSVTVAYLAIEKGQAYAGGKLLTVGDTILKFTSAASIPRFNVKSQDVAPMYMAQFQTANRTVTSLLRIRSTKEGCYVKVRVDNTDTGNCAISLNSPIEETVGWMCISDDPTGIAAPQVKTSQPLLITVNGSSLDIEDNMASAATVYSLNGVAETSVKMVDGKASVDLSTLSAGVHVIKTTSGKTAKVVTGK